MQTPENTLQVRMLTAMAGACNCLTKTPVFHHHADGCRFRALGEAADRIAALEAQVNTARLSVEDFKGGLHKVPTYVDRVNKEIQQKLAEAYSPILNLPAVFDRMELEASRASQPPQGEDAKYLESTKRFVDRMYRRPTQD